MEGERGRAACGFSDTIATRGGGAGRGWTRHVAMCVQQRPEQVGRGQRTPRVQGELDGNVALSGGQWGTVTAEWEEVTLLYS